VDYLPPALQKNHPSPIPFLAVVDRLRESSVVAVQRKANKGPASGTLYATASCELHLSRKPFDIYSLCVLNSVITFSPSKSTPTALLQKGIMVSISELYPREPIAYRLQWIKPCFSKPKRICRATHAIACAQGENTRLIRIACPTSNTFSFQPKTKKESLVQWSGCISLTGSRPSVARPPFC